MSAVRPQHGSGLGKASLRLSQSHWGCLAWARRSEVKAVPVIVSQSVVGTLALVMEMAHLDL